ncbi:MAG: hemolysin family protein [Ignavibacteriaceae bacterium]
MDINWQIRLVLLLLLLGLSAFFSGSEVALFSLEKKKIKDLFRNYQSVIRYIQLLLDNPRRLLVSILIGNTVVNVAASIIAVTLAIEAASIYNIPTDLALLFQIIVLTALIILFGELLPKVIASRNNIFVTRLVAIPVYWVSVLVFPVAEIFAELMRTLTSKFKLSSKSSALSPEEIPELTKLGREMGTILAEEHEIINSIISIKTVTASEVMTPRVDMIALPESAGLNEVFELIKSSGHSRIPVYAEDIDSITGIVYAKDLLPYLRKDNSKQLIKLSDIARKPMFVPETKQVDSLLHEFQNKKMHIAIVVDEYGGTAGLVTLEDIIEEVIGEIRDEYDVEEAPFVSIGENKYSVLGKLPLDELREITGIEIDESETDYGTVGGLVYHKAGTIPKVGYSFVLDDYKFTVAEVVRKRIKRIIIEKVN